jgi:hypothetical protein
MITICKAGRDSDFNVMLRLTSTGPVFHITPSSDPDEYTFTPVQAWNFLYSESVINQNGKCPTKTMLELANEVINSLSTTKPVALPSFHLDDEDA